MIFSSGFVVCFGGFEFACKGAEVDSFAIDADAGAPSLHIVRPVDALVFRARVRFELPPVPDVLRVRCRPEVRLSIVQAVMVDVVAEHAGGNIDEKTVHLEIFSLFLFSVRQRVYRVPGARAFLGVPFVGPQPVVIFGIDDREFSTRKRDFPESVAVPDPPI